ncbi:MAG: DMT family transporter [Candidatus Latescibacterota bacterium]|nr:DMT family transporter [Candidatus Latescibacterota bacterium]
MAEVDRRKAYLYGIATVLLWSTVASAFKLSLRYLDYAQLLLYASAVSTVALGCAVLVQGKVSHLWSEARRAWGRALLLGLCNPLAYYLVLFSAYERLPAQEAQPLNYTWALTLALLSVPLLKQRLRWQDGVGGIVCYAGVLVISTHGDVFALHFTDSLGVVLALGSTVLWALYWIFNTREAGDPTVRLFLNFALSLPVVGLYCAWQSSLWPVPIEGLVGAGYVGLFEMGVAFVLWQQALRYAENTAQVGNLIFVSPFLSLGFIYLLVDEAIRPSTPVGLALVVAGLVLQQMRSSAQPIPNR